ncbi:MAG TPA: hypothetical protein VGA73_00400, partial [Candidatus Binatia bacterium]
AKPIGEFANNCPPAAIANAVADAVGARLFTLPITAEKIHAALAKTAAGENTREARREAVGK